MVRLEGPSFVADREGIERPSLPESGGHGVPVHESAEGVGLRYIIGTGGGSITEGLARGESPGRGAEESGDG